MAALVLMLLARVLVLLAALSLARELLLARQLLARALRALLLMLLTRELLAQAELLLAQTPQEFLVSLLPLEVFAKCFESAVALGFS